jgi:hypothetical protein
MRARTITGTVTLLALVGFAVAGSDAWGQAANRRRFRVRTDQAGVEGGCRFAARSDIVTNLDRRSFQARSMTQNVTIGVLGGVVTQAQVDAALGAATTLLQADQGGGADVPCCIAIRRTGNVGVVAAIGDGDANVETSAEVQAAVGAGFSIVVVNTITFCSIAGTFNGCQSGGSLILAQARVTNLANTDTIAHEIGHRQGLPHTAPCPSGTCCPTSGPCNAACTGACDSSADERTIMHCRSNNCFPTRDTINAAECSAFQTGAAP